MGPSCGQGGHSIASGRHGIKVDLEPLRVTFISSVKRLDGNHVFISSWQMKREVGRRVDVDMVEVQLG